MKYLYLLLLVKNTNKSKIAQMNQDTDVKYRAKPLLVIPFPLGSNLLGIILIIIAMYFGEINNIAKAIYFFLHWGWWMMIILFLFNQAYSSKWILYDNILIVKRPRPIFNKMEFLISDIDKISFNVPNIGVLNPWLKVYCRNKKYKVYDFGFWGNQEKMEKLLSLLKQRNIEVEIIRGVIKE